jgi:GNAT superfamily N-acetyltransferase
METGKIHCRLLNRNDYHFFRTLISMSPKWKATELKEETIETYMSKYEYVYGEWRVWEQNQIPFAITHHTESSPSNKKPWLGTILVLQEWRKKGLGETILDMLSDELSEKGHKAIFAGVPIMENEWIAFLSQCGYEQFKLEKDKEDNQFLILVKPTRL